MLKPVQSALQMRTSWGQKITWTSLRGGPATKQSRRYGGSVIALRVALRIYGIASQSLAMTHLDCFSQQNNPTSRPRGVSLSALR